MDQGLAAMKAALRVLSVLADKRNPDPSDVEEFRRSAPLLAHIPPDELACDVVNQVMKQRADFRGGS